jgi:dTDP-4-dehydrorhamnose 3,5-epimerase
VRIVATDIPDVKIVEPRVLGDERGYFLETWREDLFAAAGIDARFVQDNQSSSGRGVLRGLHYQIRQPQGKLVRVIAGRVFDVAVDLRRGSPTCGRWAGAELSAENRRLMWVPPGFGHGFYVLSEGAEFVYKCSDYYAPEHERVIRWDDPDLGIAWPLVPGIETVLSAKDRAGVPFAAAELFP